MAQIHIRIDVETVVISNRRMLVCSFRNQEKTRFPPHPLLSVHTSKQPAQFAYPNISEEA